MTSLPASAEESRRPVVLVVEDEILTRLEISDHLRDHGYTVLEAASSAEAKSVFDARLAVDVVFTDVYFPGDFDGFSLARWVKSQHPAIPVIITSGVVRVSDADAAAARLADRPLVPKPYDVREVEAEIRRLLALRDDRGSKSGDS